MHFTQLNQPNQPHDNFDIKYFLIALQIMRCAVKNLIEKKMVQMAKSFNKF